MTRAKRPAPPCGTCSTCRRWIRLDAAGNVGEHLRSRLGPGPRNRCDGSGCPPYRAAAAPVQTDHTPQEPDR